MGRYLSLPILAFCVVLQSSILPQIRIASGQPSLVLLFVLAWSLNAELDDALFWAVTGGIMQDLMSQAPLGTSSLSLVMIAFVANSIRRQVYSVNIVMLLGLVLAGTIVFQVTSLLILAMVGMPYGLIEMIRNVLIPTLFYNLLLIYPVYFIVRWIQRRLTTGLNRI